MRKIFLLATILFCITCAGCFQGNSTLIITDDGKVFMLIASESKRKAKIIVAKNQRKR